MPGWRFAALERNGPLSTRRKPIFSPEGYKLVHRFPQPDPYSRWHLDYLRRHRTGYLMVKAQRKRCRSRSSTRSSGHCRWTRW